MIQICGFLEKCGEGGYSIIRNPPISAVPMIYLHVKQKTGSTRIRVITTGPFNTWTFPF